MNDYQEYLVGEFVEEYEEGRLSRRQALKMISSITGSLLVANTILAACAPLQEATPAAMTTAPAQASNTPAAAMTATATAESQLSETTTSASETPVPASENPPAQSPAYGTVSPDDPAVEAGDLEFPGEGATLMGYLARPVVDGPRPVVLVCHENRGLTDHIRDVARRLAKAGYVALAVDLLSRQGGSDTVGYENVPGALGNTPPDQFIQDFLSGWRFLQTLPEALADRVGMVGFCFGGGVTWRMATRMPELLVAVPFYGPHPPLEDVPNIHAAVLAIYGGNDTRINQGIPAIEEAMREHGKIYEKVIYPGADHAFHNDTGSRYNAEAAQDAWNRTLAWFATYVRDA